MICTSFPSEISPETQSTFVFLSTVSSRQSGIFLSCLPKLFHYLVLILKELGIPNSASTLISIYKWQQLFTTWDKKKKKYRKVLEEKQPIRHIYPDTLLWSTGRISSRFQGNLSFALRSPNWFNKAHTSSKIVFKINGLWILTTTTRCFHDTTEICAKLNNLKP